MIAIGSDHRGYKLKAQIVEFLKDLKLDFVDVGTNSEESTDFPIYAKKVALKVLEDEKNIGILICHSGNGMVMASNRFKGVRAALCSEEMWVELARRDDLANVLVLPSGLVDLEKAKKLINTFINTSYGGERYMRRAKMIDDENY